MHNSRVNGPNPGLISVPVILMQVKYTIYTLVLLILMQVKYTIYSTLVL